MSKQEITQTEEQLAIVEATEKERSSLMIEAYAGCAKTTSLELLGRKVRGPALALAFNKSIAEELKTRFASNFVTSTMNSFGFGALRRAYPDVTKWNLDERKVGRLVSDIAKESKVDLDSEEWGAIRQVVSAAQSSGLRPEELETETWIELAKEKWIELDVQGASIAQAVLRENNRQIELGNISFDDQVYWPTVEEAIRLPQYPTILVDEAQDLSPLQHSMLAKATGERTRLFVCGDSRQAIYGFRGAHSESMSFIKHLRPEWLERPLTLTFRCPKVVVERQQRHAPGFRAWHGNAEGIFSSSCAKAWDWNAVEEFRPAPAATLAVLCRNNAPLFSLAFKLLRRGIGVVMLGRDLGKGLKGLVSKLAPSDLPLVKFMEKLERWAETEIELAKLNKRGDEGPKIDSVCDRRECLVAIADGAQVRGSEELKRAIDKVFERERGVVTLSSIHKAKGLEWDAVLHLDPGRIPSRQARQAKERGDRKALEQEWNLRYVTETRSKHTLIEADLRDFDLGA